MHESYQHFRLTLQSGWRSRDQLMVMYNANSKLVDDLVQRKRSENLVKEHPDFPENPQMNMFWVP